jgi:hypothetical protein
MCLNSVIAQADPDDAAPLYAVDCSAFIGATLLF